MGHSSPLRKMRNLFTLLTFIIIACRAYSIPARPFPVIVSQGDGTCIEVYLRGDERFHFTSTKDNMPIVQGENGVYYYVAKQEGHLVSSEIIAHNKEERDYEEQKYVSVNRERLIEHIDSLFDINVARETNLAKSVTSSTEKRTTYKGKKRGLVILVDFPDLAMVTDNSHDEFNRQFNQIGYNSNYHVGSVHDYFFDQSYGMFDLSFDIVGPVTVSRHYSYYGANSSWNTRTDIHVGQMIAEACRLADKEVNYSDYDWDGDGEVDQVYIIYAGYGEASGAPANTIWPHEFSLTGCAYNGDGEGSLTLDGVVIDTYACSSELAGNSGKIMDGIGTACHEFSHCLGFPDFYDVKSNGGFGMSSWDIMDSGSYNGPRRYGEVPCGYTAYERWLAGWLDFIEIDDMERIKEMPNLGDSPVAYIIYNDNNHDEYFILENRQSSKWFQYVNTSVNCHGLMITHVDYSARAWLTNSVNTNSEHQRMSIVPADNDYGSYQSNGIKGRYVPSNAELEGDLFPGSYSVKEFTNTSHVNVGGRLYNPNMDGTFFLNKPVTNIKETNGVISFDFMGGIYVPTPHSVSSDIVEKDAFVVRWDIVGDVDSYEVEVVEVRKKTPLESIMTSENFVNFLTDLETGDGKMDLSTYLNSYTQNSGWSGKRIYTSPLGAKVGNGTEAGHLMTPFLNSEANSITIKITIQPSEGETNPVWVSLVNERNDTVHSFLIENLHQKHSYVFTFLDIEKGYYAVNIKGNQPFYVSSFSMYDGNFSEDDLKMSSIIGFAKPVEKYFVSGIIDRTCAFYGLGAKTFQYRVRAEKDEAFSQWTEYNTVNLDAANGMRNCEQDERSGYKIYNLQGMETKGAYRGGINIIDYGTNKKKIMK